jgi:uncharacterized protein (UPF0333 family)
MNKKGQLVIDVMIWIVIILVIIGICYVGFLFFKNTGSSVDTAYGVEKNLFWYKLYLKDDH